MKNKLKLPLGYPVTLNPSYAKWHLDNPEVYGYTLGKFNEYEDEHQLHLMSVMGVDIPGVIRGLGHDCYLVEFRCAGLSMKYYCEAKHLIFTPLEKLFF